MSMPKKKTEAGGPLDGEKLRRARKNAGLTQEELGNLAGMRVQNIVRLERDQVSDPALSTIVALTRALDVELHEVIRDCMTSAEWGNVFEYVRDTASMCRGWVNQGSKSPEQVEASRVLTELSESLSKHGSGIPIGIALKMVRGALRKTKPIETWWRATEALETVVRLLVSARGKPEIDTGQSEN